MTKYVVVLCAAFLVGGCAYLQQAAEQQRGADRAYLLALQQRCVAYGFRPETDAFANCIRREHLCEQDKGRAQMEYGLAMMRESSRPGSSALGAMQRAEAQTQSAFCQ